MVVRTGLLVAFGWISLVGGPVRAEALEEQESPQLAGVAESPASSESGVARPGLADEIASAMRKLSVLTAGHRRALTKGAALQEGSRGEARVPGVAEAEERLRELMAAKSRRGVVGDEGRGALTGTRNSGVGSSSGYMGGGNQSEEVEASEKRVNAQLEARRKLAIQGADAERVWNSFVKNEGAGVDAQPVEYGRTKRSGEDDLSGNVREAEIAEAEERVRKAMAARRAASKPRAIDLGAKDARNGDADRAPGKKEPEGDGVEVGELGSGARALERSGAQENQVDAGTATALAAVKEQLSAGQEIKLVIPTVRLDPSKPAAQTMEAGGSGLASKLEEAERDTSAAAEVAGQVRPAGEQSKAAKAVVVEHPTVAAGEAKADVNDSTFEAPQSSTPLSMAGGLDSSAVRLQEQSRGDAKIALEEPQFAPKNVLLRWRMEAPGHGVRLQISRDAGFKDLLLDKSTWGQQLQFARPAKGDYHLRLKVLQEGGETGQVLEQPFMVQGVPWFESIW